MPLFEVAVLSVPTQKEIDDGKVEELVVPPTTVMAKDANTAGIAMAMQTDKKFDPMKCQVLIRPFA